MEFWQSLIETINGNQSLLQLVLTILVLIGYVLVRGATKRFVGLAIQDREVAYRWMRATRLITAVVLILLLMAIWLQTSGSVATYLGLLSAGLAIALQDFIANLASWAFIVLKRPFIVGDRIQINQIMGDVVDIHFLQFTLLEVASAQGAQQNTGRLIHIPNRQAVTASISNESQEWPFIWEELPVLLTFESDWQLGKRVITDIVKKHAAPVIQIAERHARSNHQMLIKFGTLTPIVYTSVADSGVLLTIRVLCNVRGQRQMIEAIWEDLLIAFAQDHTLDLAYMTRRTVTQFAPDPPATPPVVESRER